MTAQIATHLTLSVVIALLRAKSRSSGEIFFGIKGAQGCNKKVKLDMERSELDMEKRERREKDEERAAIAKLKFE